MNLRQNDITFSFGDDIKLSKFGEESNGNLMAKI